MIIKLFMLQNMNEKLLSCLKLMKMADMIMCFVIRKIYNCFGE